MTAVIKGLGGVGSWLHHALLPLMLALHAWALLWPLIGLWGSLGVGLLVWAAGAALLRRVRPTRAPRRVTQGVLLTVLAVLLWEGAGSSVYEPASASTATGAYRTPAPTGFRAGVATVPIVLPTGTPLAGWGKWPRRLRVPAWLGLGPVGRLSRSLLRPEGEGPAAYPLFVAAQASPELGARALVLQPEQGPPFVLVRLDLIVGDADLSVELVSRLEDLGVRPESLIIAATHTHSGPGGFCRTPLAEVAGTDWYRADVARALLEAAERAVRLAHAGAVSARLAVVTAHARLPDGAALLGYNRRSPDPGDVQAVDTQVQGLRLDDEHGKPLAAVLFAAVHPVLFRASHGALNTDLAGALEDALRVELGDAPVLFVNGAVADVTPRRGAQEPAERARELAQEFAQQVGDSFRNAPAHALIRLQAARRTLGVGTPHAVLGVGARGALSQALQHPPWRVGGALDWLGLPLSGCAWAGGFPQARVLVSSQGLGIGVNLSSLVGTVPHALGAWRLDTGPGAEPLALLYWHPGEPTQALGRSWRAELAGRSVPVLLHVAHANGAMGYLVTPKEYDEGGYESEVSLYGPLGGQRVGEALLDCARDLGVADAVERAN